MKNRTFNYSKIILLMVLLFAMTVSCERDISDEVEFATNSNTGDIFTDVPIGLGTFFYFPFTGSKQTAWDIDLTEGYESLTSMRFDVPNANDPEGGYAGAAFIIDGAGRDLTEFDALTFWAKASQGVNIGEIGFGIDFEQNKYQTSIANLSFSTNWVKYIIPIPDASKLIEERGMLYYSAGTEETGGFGYTFWIDDLKFEKLGTLGNPRPEIVGGDDIIVQTFIGADGTASRSVTFNLPSGLDQTVSLTPSYFDWTSSDPSVVAIEDFGRIVAISSGTSIITASLAGVEAAGSLTLEVLGNFVTAPIPPARDPAKVISVFSDAYNNVPVDYYNGYFIPDGQTTQGQDDIFINGDNIISYTDLNFVGIGTFFDVAPINASEMTHLHIDLNVREAIDSGDSITLQLLNDVGGNETSGSVTINGSELSSQDWASFDISLDDFTGLGSRNALGLLFFISSTISDIYVDNIYYYKE